MITAGVIILLFVAYQLLGTNLTEEHNQSKLAKQFNAAVTAAKDSSSSDDSTIGPTVNTPPGGAIDHLVIPKIGVNRYVVQGTDEDDLTRGPGHYVNTVFPGEDGNSAIAGHRTTYGAPFFNINELTTGDLIYITNLAGKKFTYKVSQPPLVVSPNDTAVLNPTPYARLTLTSCNPRFLATSRIIIIARLTSIPLPVTQAPQLVKSVSSLNNGNDAAWPATILYGAIVVLLWALTRLFINRTRRWWRLSAYVVGIGVCTIPLWCCFENVVQILPGSI